MQMDLLKYSNYDVVFQEIPGEVALAINITQCPHHCDGCHSAVLAGDFGNYLRDDFGLFEPAFPYLDFLKIGPYKKELGGLTSSNTNQRFYRKENGEWVDRTQLFQRKGDQSNDDYYEES